MIKKYEEQQKNVRNNREFDSLSKEIEFQTLEIQLSEKRMKEFEAQIIQKKEVIEESTTNLSERKKDLDHKQKNLTPLLRKLKRKKKPREARQGSAAGR